MKKYIEAVILFAKVVMVLAKIFGMWSENQQRMHEGSSMAYTADDFTNTVKLSGIIEDTAYLKASL